MYGLTMIKEYLVEILSGYKTYDARSYPTYKRGTIALIDSRTMKAYGTVELINCREISASEYCSWHCTGKWAGCIMEVDTTKKYYAWYFINPKVFDKPIKINAIKHTWVEILNELVNI